MSNANKPIKLSTQCIVRIICVGIGLVLIIIGALIWPKPDDGLINMYEDIRTSVIVICVGIVLCLSAIAGDILQRSIELERTKKQDNQYNDTNSNQYNNYNN